MDADIQSYMRVAASHNRDTERIGPFLATFTPTNNNPYLNYALPDDGAQPSPADVAALIAAFGRRLRVPRLEYVATLAPAVESALLAAGFTVEGRMPLMICTPETLLIVPPPSDIELIFPASEAEMFNVIKSQDEAFGGSGLPDPDAVRRMQAGIASGSIVALARVAATGEPVGGGVCTVPSSGMTEVAGIGVRPPFRRRGVAGALTGFLTQQAFASGVTLAFLTPADEPAGRVYTRAGFSIMGEILHISLPSSTA